MGTIGENIQGRVNGIAGTGGTTEHRFVKPANGADMQVVAAGAGDFACGVAEDTAAAGASVSIVTHGDVIVEAAGAITRAGVVMSNSAGKATAGTGAGNAPLGIALETAANDGDLILVRLYLTMKALA